jgi:hypothetical protein
MVQLAIEIESIHMLVFGPNGWTEKLDPLITGFKGESNRPGAQLQNQLQKVEIRTISVEGPEGRWADDDPAQQENERHGLLEKKLETI